MTSLQRLRLGGTQMQGVLPSSLFTLPRLIELNLDRAQFSGGLSEDFARLNETIEEIILSNNTFTGPIPQSFDVLEYLGTLASFFRSLRSETSFAGMC
jgi:hypothetical protein